MILVVAFLLAVGKLLIWMGGECVSSFVDRLPSPDGSWVAVVEENTCDVGPFGTDITAGVHLVTTRPPLRDIELLGSDTGGDSNYRPVVVWSAPNLLRVTVPLRSDLEILTTQVEEIHVDVHFDPDGPAAREAWLKEREAQQQEIKAEQKEIEALSRALGHQPSPQEISENRK